MVFKTEQRFLMGTQEQNKDSTVTWVIFRGTIVLRHEVDFIIYSALSPRLIEKQRKLNNIIVPPFW